MAFLPIVTSALDSSYAGTQAELTATLRRQALDAGWTAAAANTIVVDVANGGFVAKAGPAAKVFEFGTDTQPPRSVLRVFNAKQDHKADDLLTRRLETALAGIL
jgi:hypothetical protein